jgi:DUF4097 and DUF4098 domain-containing protein YvlB
MRVCLVLISLLLAPTLLSQDLARESAPPRQSPYVEREEREFNFFPGGKVEIFLSVPGSLKVVGWKKASVRVEAEKIVYYETEEKAKAFLKKSPVRIRHNETSTAIRVAAIPEPPAILEVNLTVYVPSEKTDVNAKIDRGEFSIDSVNGWVEATVKEGSLEAKSMAGYFSGSLLRGDILVEMSGKYWNGLELAVVTQQGSANHLLPIEYSAALQLETRNGKITVDYPTQIVEGEEAPPDIVIRKNSQSLKASVGKGGAPLRIITYSGDVALSKLEK